MITLDCERVHCCDNCCVMNIFLHLIAEERRVVREKLLYTEIIFATPSLTHTHHDTHYFSNFGGKKVFVYCSFGFHAGIFYTHTISLYLAHNLIAFQQTYLCRTLSVFYSAIIFFHRHHLIKRNGKVILVTYRAAFKVSVCLMLSSRV